MGLNFVFHVDHFFPFDLDLNLDSEAFGYTDQVTMLYINRTLLQ
jgi:hypothetical protein